MNRGCIQTVSSFFLSFTPSILLHFPPFHVHTPQSSTVAFSLFLYLLSDPVYSYDRLQCTPRSVRYWQSGESTSIEKDRCFWSCIVLRVASDPEYPTHTTGIPLSAPPHRTLVDFLSEVPLFERVGRVLRWPWRKPVVLVVSSTEKNCRFNIVIYPGMPNALMYRMWDGSPIFIRS